MTDAELIDIATEFRDGILDGRPSKMMCYMVSAPLAGFLNFYGLRADLIGGDLGHFWIRLADGRVLDPTADQFNDEGFEVLPPVYLGPPTMLHPPPESTP